MKRNQQNGFTLLELAVVLIIVTLLSGGLLMAVSAQMEGIATSETRQRLNDARDALLGYAAANGRLPCPADASSGYESPINGGKCNNVWDGYLPAVTLGLHPTNDQGLAIDGWGNPIRYALTAYTNATYCAGAHCFATSNALKNIWDGGGTPVPDIQICASASGMTGSGGSAKCATGNTLTDSAVGIIYSRGKNGAVPPSSVDEVANGDADRLFVSHTPTPPGANEFDDLVIWLSPNILYNRMIAAGRLP